MFVSSYSTYITNNTSEKATKTTSSREEKSNSFTEKLSKSTATTPPSKQNPSINYISEGQTQYNKQMLEVSQNSKENEFKTTNTLKEKFSSNASLQNAKVAYSSNSTMFSLLKKPTATINQTPRIDRRQPQDIQEIKENNMRQEMVNTYIANDNYYKVTA